MIRLFLLFVLIFFKSIFSFETGVLNVFTDLPGSTIMVNGLIVGKESITKLPLQVGEHYVQVELNKQIVYAEKVTINNNRSTTVVSEHFVDIITKTPSRGAIDREAARIRESRGNFAIGYSFKNFLQDAISINWWTHDRMGVQLLAGGAIPGTDHRGTLGGRLFFSPADKIYADDIISGGIFAGIGNYKRVRNSGFSSSEVVLSSYYETGVFVEAYIGKLVNEFMKIKYSNGIQFSKKTIKKKTKKKKDGSVEETHTETADLIEPFRDLLIIILSNIGHTRFEVSLVKLNDQKLETCYSTGINFYF